MSAAPHGLVLLAAGASRRLGRPKQLVVVDGETLVRRAAHGGLATAPLDAVIVLGHAAGDIGAAVADLPLRAVVADDWREGMGASLACGVAMLDERCDGVLVLLCDQPALDAAHCIALVDTWRARRTAAAASAYAGVLGVPAVLPRAWLAEPGALAGDHGARELLRSAARHVVAVDAPALARDVDRVGDLPVDP
ncbi:nucleotidyltransferase family protein [Tahibacter soli]|uniref:Nucleotidyltransferase family protein n=1 Tax=Tahibacter soli TaxID=2983605 RepID=A0A9X4BHH4_9GAMM|nr:nucleotidyltransferase family protein [Tahibacter soli]MDC8014160.1 nucleotidyltransferase family protein [Tahibacter soli]